MRSIPFLAAAIFATSVGTAQGASLHSVQFFGTGGLNSGPISQTTGITRTDSAVQPLIGTTGVEGSASTAYTHSSSDTALAVGASATVETFANSQSAKSASVQIDNGAIQDTLTFSGVAAPFDVFFDLNVATNTLLSEANAAGTFASVFFTLSVSRVGGIAAPNSGGALQVIENTANSASNTTPSGPLQITVTPGSSLSVLVSYDVSVGARTVASGADTDFATANGTFNWFMDAPDGTVFTSDLGLSYAEAAAVPLPAAGGMLLAALAGLGAITRRRLARGVRGSRG